MTTWVVLGGQTATCSNFVAQVTLGCKEEAHREELGGIKGDRETHRRERETHNGGRRNGKGAKRLGRHGT